MLRSRDDDEPDWLRSAAAQLGGAPEKENDPAQAPPPPAAAADAPGKVRELEQETRRQEKIVGKLMRELKLCNTENAQLQQQNTSARQA